MVPSRYSHDPIERRAAVWADKQKITYEEGKLSADNIEVLNTTPGWCWERENYSFKDSVENWKL